VLDHLLPMTARAEGMAFDIATATSPAAISLDRIPCPVLTISTEDDLFGTAARAREIAGEVPHGRAVIYPTGGHALVGHFDDVLREAAAFFSQPPQPTTRP
jgi:fermentation-respiration switch protein FrsA (DUF1100 family)